MTIIFLTYVIALCWLTVSEIFKRISVFRIVSYFAGGFSIFFGLVLAFLFINIGYEKYGLSILVVLIFPIWIILLGVRDLIFLKTVANNK